MPSRTVDPLISVVIPTRNRAALLRASLESLACQTLTSDAFEIIVIDDGSTDETRRVCERAARALHLRYLRIDHAGIAAAKNLGVFAATAPLLLFFDDDDLATRDLLYQHLIAHHRYPAETVAVLGYTTWAPTIHVSEVMRFATDVGQVLFAYTTLRSGQELDFTYFWGGRSSCKRRMLVMQGVFNQQFDFGCEDVELGYRLSKRGLTIRYSRSAVQHMNRPVTFREFCGRCERQGRAQAAFSRLHADPVIQDYCQVSGAAERWREMSGSLAGVVDRVDQLEENLRRTSPAAADSVRSELHNLYRWTFNAFMMKGLVSDERRKSDGGVP